MPCLPPDCFNPSCISAAVEEQCQAILDAAKEAVQSYMQEVQLQLVGLPKKVLTMLKAC